MALLVHILFHSFRGGLQFNKVEHRQKPQPELLCNEQSACDACVHDFRVHTTELLLCSTLLTYRTFSEGWNQFMHD